MKPSWLFMVIPAKNTTGCIECHTIIILILTTWWGRQRSLVREYDRATNLAEWESHPTLCVLFLSRSSWDIWDSPTRKEKGENKKLNKCLTRGRSSCNKDVGLWCPHFLAMELKTKNGQIVGFQYPSSSLLFLTLCVCVPYALVS